MTECTAQEGRSSDTTTLPSHMTFVRSVDSCDSLRSHDHLNVWLENRMCFFACFFDAPINCAEDGAGTPSLCSMRSRSSSL